VSENAYPLSLAWYCAYTQSSLKPSKSPSGGSDRDPEAGIVTGGVVGVLAETGVVVI